MINQTRIFSTVEYQAISLRYGDKCAVRSGVPLINHIDEGIDVLFNLGADLCTMQAFALHPLVQADDALIETMASDETGPSQFDGKAMLLAMEYRRAANAYLCRPDTDGWDIEEAKRNIGLLLPEVAQMLIADKVQNRKDFMTYHYGTHQRSNQLITYFNNWHHILGVKLPDSHTATEAVPNELS